MSRPAEDLRMNTTSQIARRSRPASKGPLRRLAPFAKPATLPKFRVNSVTTRLDSLKSTDRITIAGLFSVDIVGRAGVTVFIRSRIRENSELYANPKRKRGNAVRSPSLALRVGIFLVPRL